MEIGLPREIERHEYRVGLTPRCVRAYVNHGHKVFVQSGAGAGSSFTDEMYRENGAEIVDTAKGVYDRAQLIVKIKGPLPEEYGNFREGHTLFAFLHLAANRELTKFLIERKVNAVAYETIELPDESLPCLRPMSEIGGRLSVQEGAKYLEKRFGGRGVLLGGRLRLSAAAPLVPTPARLPAAWEPPLRYWICGRGNSSTSTTSSAAA